MRRSVITGTGLWTPSGAVSNAELVEAHTRAVEAFNRNNADAIAAGEIEERELTSERFIVKASGIESRYVIDKQGVLDPERLRPHIPTRNEDEMSIQCEIGLVAAREALAQAGREASEIDAIFVACSNLQRAYPAVAVEIQHRLGAGGWAYDLNVACSSATFGIQAATDAIANGSAKRALVISPEITSGHNNFELRDFHFIFGDACTAVLLEAEDGCEQLPRYDVLGTRLATQFSNNIRNDFGFLNVCEDEARSPHEKLFRQQGRKVFREVCPMVAEHIREHLESEKLEPSQLRRMWLHQANLSMNQLIAKTLLGRPPEHEDAPVILDEFANTSSAGSIIAFHRHRDDLREGDIGVICSFGAGYSVGSVLLRARTLE